MSIDILGISEPNLNFARKTIKNTFRTRIQNRWKVSKTVISHLNNNHQGNHQMGGTLLITRNNWCGRIVETFQDPIGRWCSVLIQGRNDTQLLVITAYRPCAMTPNGSKTRTIWMQQWEYLTKQGEKYPNPRNKCLVDLRQHITGYLAKWNSQNTKHKRGIIMGWDANEGITKTMENFMQTTSLVEIFSLQYQNDAIPNTCNRGKHSKIDHIMVTPNLVPHILSSGMTGFGSGIRSDHRGMFVDIDIKKFLQGDSIYVLPPTMRRVHTRDPRLVKEYVLQTYNYMCAHNYENRLLKLSSMPHDDPEATQLIEQLDRDMVRARLQSAKKLGKRFIAGWSPELRKTFMAVQYWETRISAIRHPGTDYNTALGKLGQDIDEKVRRSAINASACHKHLKQSARRFQETIQNSNNLRQEYLLERAKALAQANNTKGESEVRRLRSIELTIETFKKLKINFKRDKKGSLNYLLCPRLNANGEEIKNEQGQPIIDTIHDLEAMEKLLIERNITHFQQAHGSPPTKADIKEKLGDGTKTKFCDDILQGKAELTELTHEGLKEMLSGMKTIAPEITLEITSEDLMLGFQNWRESTTTSPSGIDLGHWRATTYDIATDETHNQRYKTILEWHAKLINETVRREHVLKRWLTVHSCMIEKTPGVPLINKLRVIHIFEAELNLILGIWNRRMQQQAEKLQILHKDQWAQKGNRAIDTAMMKKLTYMYSTITRTDLGTLDTDAKSCYDRMISSLVTLRNRQLGMPSHASAIQSIFLDNARFHVKTKLGISKIAYGNTTKTPQYGQGQGAKWAPMSWIGISTLMLDVIARTNRFGIVITDPTSTHTDCRQMDGYVDDFTSWVNNPNQITEDPQAKEQSGKQSTGMLKSLTQQWEHLLACTGGRLELPKCFYYGINWIFDKNGRATINGDTTSEINLSDTLDPENKEMIITKKHPHDPHRTLGVFISPTEDESMAIEELTKKCNKFAALVRTATNNLSKREMSIFMTSLYKPAISYPLTASALTEDQCRKIQSTVVHNLAVAMGYNRNSPTTLLHAPLYLGGANIPDLYCEQGISQIMYIIRHIRGETRTGRVLLILFNWIQIYCGTTGSIWEDVLQKIEKYLPIKWINSVRQFLRNTNLHLHIGTTYRIQKRRLKDESIMEIALKHQCTSGELQDINNCRMYLHVEMISDITNAAGTELQPKAIDSQPPTGPHSTFFTSSTTRLFPRQAIPGPIAWKHWLQLMKTICQEGNKTKLETPLGRWLCGNRTDQRTWKQYLRVTDGALIQRIEEQNNPVKQYTETPVENSKRTSRIYRQHSQLTRPVQTPSEDQASWIPIDIVEDNRMEVIITPQYTHSDLIQQVYSNADEWKKQFLKQILDQERRKLKEYLSQEVDVYILAYRIASVNDHYQWIIYLPNSKVYFQNHGIANGLQITSKRCELFGLLACLTILETTLSEINRMQRKVERIVCHATIPSITRRLQSWNRYKSDVTSPDWDTTEMIHRINEKTGITPLYLNWPATSNIPEHLRHMANIIESLKKNNKIIVTSQKHNKKCLQKPLPTQGATLQTNEHYICSNEENELRRILNEQDYIEYLKHNKQFSNKTISEIAWTERNRVMKSLEGNKCRFIGKLMHGWLPTSARMNSIGETEQTTCLRCGLEPETTEHIFTCPTATEWRTKTLETLRQSLGKTTNFGTKIYYSFKQWVCKHEETIISTEGDRHGNLETENIDIEWNHGMCGLFPYTWIHKDRIESRELQNIIRWSIESSFEAWQQRCHNIHHHEKQQNKTESLLHRQLQHKARELFAKKEDLLHSDRQYFDFDIEEFIRNKSIREITLWLRHTKTFVKHAQGRAKAEKHGDNILKFIQKDKYPP